MKILFPLKVIGSMFLFIKVDSVETTQFLSTTHWKNKTCSVKSYCLNSTTVLSGNLR